MPFAAPSWPYALIFKHRARSTHHKIALSALLHLKANGATAWRDAFLSEADAYLKGAKAPDDVFRDSMNQVLHVRDGYWGGAPQAAESWYAQLVERLRQRAWTQAAFAAGVLSHYWSDPIQPLHTGQTEAEGPIHRALEQSIAKSWDAIIARIAALPDVSAAGGPGWLAQMVRAGAEHAAPHYDLCIDHYALEPGIADPPAGLDDALKDALAQCLAHAVAGFAAILDRAIAEAAVSAPRVNLTLQTAVTIIGIPVQAILKKTEDAEERAFLKQQFAEFQATGKVIKTQSHDDRMVRAAHARDVLGLDIEALDAMPARKPGALHGKPAAARPPVEAERPLVETIHAEPIARPIAQPPAPPAAPAPRMASAPVSDRLPLDAPVEDAPAIGPMTAVRLADIGCRTIADLYALDPDAAAAQLAAKHISAADIRRWQAAARLYASVRTLNQTEAHLLAALGIDNITTLQEAEAAPLADRIADFAATGPGQRIVRDGKTPDVLEVKAWIEASRTPGAAGRAA
jgi:hypothetical protein